MTEQAKLYCNITALNPVERAHYQELTNKLALNRRNAIEIARGYEFQFNASAISLADLAEWVAYESKCSPFFDFYIGLRSEGTLLSLQLTGEHGVKPFIRAELQLPSK